MEILKMFKVEALAEIRQIINDKSQGDKWVDKVNDYARDFVTKTLPKLDKTKLKIVKIKGHKLRFFEHWNSFIKGKITERDYECLVNEWSNNMVHVGIMCSSRDKLTQEEVIRGAKIRFDTTFKNCSITGDYIITSFDDDFEFKFSKSVSTEVDLGNGKTGYTSKIVPVGEVSFKNTIYEKIVEFKTGNLIINDWFRTTNNEFTDAVKSKNFISINYPKGVVEQISRYADMNLVSVNIGNSCASVYKIKDSIIVGEGPEMEQGSVYHGNICTDLWNGTIIDESEFIDILVKTGMTKTLAKKELAKQKEIWTCIELTVKPGKYKLSFCGSYEDFNKKFRLTNKNTTLSKKYKPSFILEKIKD